MTNSVLSVRNLSVEFAGKSGYQRVVHDLSFDIGEGETLAIVGESGSGKSVSSLSILQLLNPERSLIEGTIVLKYEKTITSLLDLEPDKMREFRGKAISMIFQEPMAALNPVLKCGEQVAEIITAHEGENDREKTRKRVVQLFKEVELPRPEEMFNSYPHELSGGQQQRVMIAMALANNPVLLIADEPTTALDPKVQDEILELISRLQRKNRMALLFISHDLDVVRKIADQVVVMQSGEVRESGSAEQVFTNPVHPYTRGLLKSKPDESKRGKVLPTVRDFLSDPDFKPKILPEKQIGKTLITLDHISVIYQSGGWLKKPQPVVAVKDVSLSLRQGETVGVIGPSGCGKTTVGRVLAGWVSPTSGQVIYKGKPVISATLSQGKTWAREVQLIFQDPFSSLNPKIRIGDAIAEPMLVHELVKNKEEAASRVNGLLERVGLSAAHADRYPHEFSGGQRQRIVIARALAVNPKILICDESVAALDVSVQAQVLNLLNELQRELGLTYLFISHDHNVIRYFCDRIVEMEAGSIKMQAGAEIKTEVRPDPVPVTVDAPKSASPVDVVPERIPELKTEDLPAEIQESEPEILITGSASQEMPVDQPEEPIWKKHLAAESTYDRISSSVNPTDSVADQVSAELLRLKLEMEHQKMERVAEEIHIPLVSAENGTEPSIDEPASVAESVETTSVRETEPVPETEPIVSRNDETAETDTPSATPVVVPEKDKSKSYGKLSEFIKGNSGK
ncbi:MAG: ABC transporter ATP-binding protein [Bacteroidota bacterium]